MILAGRDGWKKFSGAFFIFWMVAGVYPKDDENKKRCDQNHTVSGLNLKSYYLGCSFQCP